MADNPVDREEAEQALVHDEVRQYGTLWAAREIWRLRHAVAGLREALNGKRP